MGPSADGVHLRVLARAARLLGGKAALRERLGVTSRELTAWMAGAIRLPDPIFLRAVDLVVDGTPGPGHDLVAARRRNLSLAEFESFACGEGDADELLDGALNAAVNETAALRGTLQVACAQGLRLVAHLGFDKRFLDFYRIVRHDTPSVCGPAHAQGKRVVVADVARHPFFEGTEAAEVMASAQAHACQSTPILDPAGTVIGMLSTHYARPHEPAEAELAAIDRVARVAGRWLSAASL